ncbi:MAG: VCBS repeat-containing protein [Paracoccaceae bacterium]
MRRFGDLALLAIMVLMADIAGATPPNIITKAEYTDPTTRYDHGILGDAIEWGGLRLTVDLCPGCANSQIREFSLQLPDNRVFEDIAPRLVELSDETGPVVMVVETDLALGARLALYDDTGLISATPFIGRTHRWLAPIGAADLDGDGQVEYAYIDRPHLARTLRIWRMQDGALTPVADLPGFTNHRIGDDYISGGIRNCSGGPEMIVADSKWRNVVAIRFDGDDFSARVLEPYSGRHTFKRALACKP